MADKDAAARRRARHARKRSERRMRTSDNTDTMSEATPAPDAASQDAGGQEPEKEAAKAPKAPLAQRLHLGRAKDKDKDRNPHTEHRKPCKPGEPPHHWRRVIGCSIAASLVVGALLGYVNAPEVRVSGIGDTKISEGDTQRVLATWTYDGKTHDITMADYASYAQLTATDGSYAVPSASDVVSYAQWQFELMVADQEGVKVTNDDVESYVKDTLGADSVSALADSYNVSEDTVRSLVTDAAKVAKLTEDKAGERPTAPSQPTAAESGKEDEATKDYASYVVKLAGDAWDSTANGGKGGWKDSSSAWAKAMADYDVTNDAASYKAAEAAYQQACSDYSSDYSTWQSKWTSWIDGRLKNVSIDLADALS